MAKRLPSKSARLKASQEAPPEHPSKPLVPHGRRTAIAGVSNAVKTLVMAEGERYLIDIEQRFGVQVLTRGEGFSIDGGATPESHRQAVDALDEIIRLAENTGALEPRVVETILDERSERDAPSPGEGGKAGKSVDLFAQPIVYDARGAAVRPKSKGQLRLVESVNSHEITFAIGPAGTGKTFLAVAMAVAALESREVDRLVLVRPAVEAGESLGYLPGDLEEKILPYLRPMVDALQELLPRQKFKAYMEGGAIEVAPLAYMRGRTLNRSFAILDEAQNTTAKQMFMFLTRIGRGSRAIVTGDPSQIDLGRHEVSGLEHACRVLRSIPGIAQVRLHSTDQMRHELVRAIIDAYNKADELIG